MSGGSAPEWTHWPPLQPVATLMMLWEQEEKRQRSAPPMNNAGIHLLTEDICQASSVSRTHARMHPAL